MLDDCGPHPAPLPLCGRGEIRGANGCHPFARVSAGDLAVEHSSRHGPVGFEDGPGRRFRDVDALAIRASERHVGDGAAANEAMRAIGSPSGLSTMAALSEACATTRLPRSSIAMPSGPLMP